MNEDYLDISEPLLVDNSVESYPYHEYNPIVGTNLNNVNSEIRIVIENQDVFTHPSKSFLVIKGRLTKADGTSYTDADAIALVNNGIMFLFNSIKYHIGDKLIDELNYPGYATTMKGLLSYGNAEQLGMVDSCWTLDSLQSAAADTTANIGFAIRHHMVVKQSTPKGSFSFIVPAKHLLGFFEDYTKVVYGVKQTLTLMRTTNADAVFRAQAVDDPKLELSHISWRVPHVLPADKPKAKILDLVDRGISVDLGFRHWHYDSCDLPATTSFTWRLVTTSAIEKPRWIVIAFQTNRQNDVKKNTAQFDHCSLADCHVMLNSERYPYLDLNVDYAKGDYAILYRMFHEFRNSLYGSDDMAVNAIQFQKQCPFVVIDCTKQSERLRDALVDVQVKMRFVNNVPAGTKCHALLIGDRKMQMKLDRGKIDVVY